MLEIEIVRISHKKFECPEEWFLRVWVSRQLFLNFLGCPDNLLSRDVRYEIHVYLINISLANTLSQKIIIILD